MKTVTERIRAHLWTKLLLKNDPMSYPFMRETQWSHQFEEYMHNRMVLGGYRYGLIRDPNTPKFDNVGSLIKRAQLYFEDGNQEHLVDVANLAMVEFVRGCCHPNPHWSPIDDGCHTEEIDLTKRDK